MRFRKQWLALLLTTAMTAANLTLPYSAVGALAAETQTVEENVPKSRMQMERFLNRQMKIRICPCLPEIKEMMILLLPEDLP